MIFKIYNRIKYEINKFIPKKHKGNKKYNLKKQQIYPEGKFFLESLNENIHSVFKKSHFTLNSNITSIGTCFAEEVSYFMLKKSKNYKVLEKNIFNFIINWGRVYTASNLKQLINYSFDDQFKIFTKLGTKGYFDPLRDYSCGSFETKSELINSIKKHRKLSKNILLNSDFIFITLGQTEAWLDKNKKFTWGATPIWCKEFFEESTNFIKKDFNLEEITTDLSYVVNTLKTNNPKIKIFLTLSPVPSQATFFDKNVILSSATGKAKIRLSIESILNRFDDIYYIPSYENVLLDNKNFMIDRRHVKRSKVKDIFTVFQNYKI